MGWVQSGLGSKCARTGSELLIADWELASAAFLGLRNLPFSAVKSLSISRIVICEIF